MLAPVLLCSLLLAPLCAGGVQSAAPRRAHASAPRKLHPFPALRRAAALRFGAALPTGKILGSDVRLSKRALALRATKVGQEEEIQVDDEEEDEDVDQRYARQLAEEVMLEQGVELDQLMSPMKAIRLFKEIAEKNQELEAAQDSQAREVVLDEIQQLSQKLATEKRSVMREELKQIFLFQSLLSIGISGLLATNHFPGFDVPLSAQALGFWTIWLFTIPSLRARKPMAKEKEALNIAFLLTPLLNIGIPFLSKDPGLIWAANVVAIIGSYAYAYTIFDDDSGSDSGLKFEGPLKWLDWGSGQERGAPKEVRERLEEQRRQEQQE